MKKENSRDFYKKVGKEIGWDFSKLNYEKEVMGDFNYWKFVQEVLDENKVVLDVGCGSGEKSIKFLEAKKIYGIDIEPEMLKKARENLAKCPEKIEMFEFLIMDADKKFDFEDESFDVVISRHCGCLPSEMHRVLKRGGFYISEDVSAHDCQELKEIFKRGQGYGQESGAKRQQDQYEKLAFSKIEQYDLVELEYYKSKDDLLYLLNHTPIIPNFGKEKDDEKILDEYIKGHTTPKGILLKRRLFGFRLKK